MKLQRKVLVIYLLVVAFAVGLSLLIFVTGQKVNSNTDYLVKEKLPKLKEINQAYVAAIANELLLYEFYASTDRDAILPKITKNRRQLERGLIRLQALFQQHPKIDMILAFEYKIIELTQANISTLDSKKINWDRARELLAQLSDTNREFTQELNNLVMDINNETIKSAKATQQAVTFSTEIVLFFTALILVLSGFIGYYVYLFAKDSNSRRRLAAFIERSPNPTLSLSWNGTVKYANHACYQLMEKMHNHSRRPETLLPDNFQQRLIEFQKSNDNHHTWVSQLEKLTVNMSISLLRDLSTCHIYIEDISEKTHAEQQLKYQAHHDVLTDLPNKRFFLENMAQKIALQPKQSFSLILIQINNFDLISATYSLNQSDSIIKSCARLITQCKNTVQADYLELFRVDSTKFALLYNETTQEDVQLPSNATTVLANLIQTGTEKAINVNQQELFISFNIGIASFPLHCQTGNQLFTNADAALTRAKATEGSTIVCYGNDISAKEQAWIKMEQQLRFAVENGELSVFFQPQYNAFSQQATGAEALLRWFKSDGTFISPADFIPIAERSGLIIPIGYWVIEQCFKQFNDWKKQLKNPNFQVAINISARQFQHPNFVKDVSELVKTYKIDTHSIELEITESLLMCNIEHSIAVMKKLKDLGFSLSIDDFGTGYSSLSYLKQFPIDKLKIDRAFIINLENDKADKAIVKTIIDLSHNLNIEVIAEGVENFHQLEILKKLNCNEIQGFYFAKPGPAKDIEHDIIKL